jgi:hypothetical protein
MIWRRNRKGTRPAAWLALFAILLQALLPAVAQQPADMTPAGLSGDTVAGLDIAQNLCHSPGDTTPDDPGKAPLDHQQCCAFCLAVHAIGGFVPPTAPAIAVSRDYGIVVPAATTLVLSQQRPTLRQQPRAPPVLI